LSPIQLLTLNSLFENYFLDVCFEDIFSKLEGIVDFNTMMVETRKCIAYPFVFFFRVYFDRLSRMSCEIT